MAHNPMFGSDLAKTSSSAARELTHPVERELPSEGVSAKSDLAELTAKFVAHGGGLSAELSADLALEILLNEIVEQACSTTGATGAAIVLKRDGEMVCRACSGTNAPELGVRLDTEAGLSGTCMRTRQTQRCDDALTDPQADSEACRQLGVRSVVVMPLMHDDELLGVFELFSCLPSAFGEADEHMLETLALRVLDNLTRAKESVTTIAASSAEGVFVEANSVPDSQAENGPAAAGSVPDQNRRGVDAATMALAGVVVACAILMGALVSVRLGWQRVGKRPAHAANTAVASPVPGKQNSNEASSAPIAVESNQTPGGSNNGRRETAGPVKKPAARASAGAPPPGSLLIYENGKEVFRLPPSSSIVDTEESSQSSELRRASAIEPAPVIEIAPEALETSLLTRVEPDYPDAARQQQIQGAVVLTLHIGQDGGVQEVKLVSGEPQLAEAAIEAVRQWRFKPRSVNGQAAEMETRVTINFRLP